MEIIPHAKLIKVRGSVTSTQQDEPENNNASRVTLGMLAAANNSSRRRARNIHDSHRILRQSLSCSPPGQLKCTHTSTTRTPPHPYTENVDIENVIQNEHPLEFEEVDEEFLQANCSELEHRSRSQNDPLPEEADIECISAADHDQEENTTLHSLSTTMAAEEGQGAGRRGRGTRNSSRASEEGDEDEVPLILEWFRVTFTEIGKHGRVTLRDLKYAAKEYEGFAEQLFKLFDTDRSNSVSLQELVGGMGRLTTHGRKVKILKWFEQVFDRVSGDDQLLQLDEFKRALQINGFMERFYQLIDTNGKLTLPELLDALGKIACMDRDAKWLAWFEQQFSIVAGINREIDLEDFKKALHVKESFFAERFFQLFDRDSSGCISLRELMDGLTLLTNGSEVDKLRFLFQVYDVDGNGHIDYNELRTVLKSCVGESTLQFSEDKLDELTRALFEDADVDNSGTISFEELKAELDKHPGVIENLTISAANWLKPPQSQRRQTLHLLLPHWATWRYIRNNLTWVIWLLLFIAINIILFVEAAVRHRSKGPAVAIARGCGQCLNFNPTFVIIVMMRRGLTWLRSTRVAFLFPLDQHIELHKMCGWLIFVFAIIHTLAHIVNFTLLSLSEDGLALWKYFFFIKTGAGWVGGTAGITGDFLIVIITIMVLCSLPCVRRKGYFEVFYWTHFLFILFYILLILHASHFWKWFLVPGIIYILERILRSKWVKLARFGRTYIQEGILLPSKVTHLVMTRPTNFSYQPGDYVFLQVPSIAKYEWHPFTISSAPEQQGFIWLHIRSVGTWTNRLYEFFDKRNKSRKRETIQMQLPRDQQNHNMEQLEQVVRTWDSQSCDFDEPLNDVHPLAVTGGFTDPMRADGGSNVTHGQDFSHLLAPPTIINVQVDNEEDKGIEVYIDGPYGTPSAHIFQAEHAVLIGAGIGVTPFASILQSVMMRYRNARQVCPRCNHGWTGDIPSSVMRLKKVDFFWINRDQRSFEWFVSLLSQLEIEQSEQCGFERFLDMHMYMTSALRKTDVKAIGLQMALDLIHKKEKRDLITGLRTRTQAGRPDWNKVFRQLDNDRKGKVTVFFCGPPAISNILKTKCSQYGFEFHKENF